MKLGYMIWTVYQECRTDLKKTSLKTHIILCALDLNQMVEIVCHKTLCHQFNSSRYGHNFLQPSFKLLFALKFFLNRVFGLVSL